MALCDEFLKQAKALAGRRGVPSQINLRRSTSAAYYALFHLLTKEAIDQMVPLEPNGLRAKASRALQHTELRDVCKDFKNASSPEKLRSLLGPTLSLHLRAVAETFVDLQDKRHAADYDVLLTLSQSEVLTSVQSARQAFQHWTSIRGSNEANVFLAALVFGKRWNR
jgi:hypothetical protein